MFAERLRLVWVFNDLCCDLCCEPLVVLVRGCVYGNITTRSNFVLCGVADFGVYGLGYLISRYFACETLFGVGKICYVLHFTLMLLVYLWLITCSRLFWGLDLYV